MTPSRKHSQSFEHTKPPQEHSDGPRLKYQTLRERTLVSCQGHGFKVGLEGTFWSGILLVGAYSIKSTSAKGFYEDRLQSRGKWSDILEPTNEARVKSRERGTSWATNHLELVVRASRGDTSRRESGLLGEERS